LLNSGRNREYHYIGSIIISIIYLTNSQGSPLPLDCVTPVIDLARNTIIA